MRIRTALTAALTAAVLALSASDTRAQGIPVIDAANLIQTVQQVMDDVTAIENQVRQIQQLQRQLDSINGARNLGNVFNNPLLKNYVPAESYSFLNLIETSGYAGLSSTAKALRDVGMVYNCLDRQGSARTDCQARLALPYQEKGMLQDAMKTAAGRLAQIQSLMDQINATTDPKAVQEIQARIGAENALLSSETVPAMDVLDKHNLAVFVRAREGYNWMFLQRDFDQVARMAVPEVFEAYNRQFEGDRALQKTVGPTEDWQINIISVRLAASGRSGEHGERGEATVTYDKVVHTQDRNLPDATTRYVASAVFEYQPQVLAKERDRLENPFGFVVTAYRSDPEVNTPGGATP